MSDMIEVSHITMDFRLDRNHTTNLKEYVVNLLLGKRKVEMFHALDDVSFTIPRGSVTGLIGPNGAGKSTILKVISGIYRPTGGQVQVRGQHWTARTEEDNTVIEAGKIVKIQKISGVKLIIKEE